MSESSLSSLDDCRLWSLVTAESLTSDRGELSLGLSLGDSRGDTAFTGMKLHTCVLWRCFLGRLPVENKVLSSLMKISLLWCPSLSGRIALQANKIQKKVRHNLIVIAASCITWVFLLLDLLVLPFQCLVHTPDNCAVGDENCDFIIIAGVVVVFRTNVGSSFTFGG